MKLWGEEAKMGGQRANDQNTGNGGIQRNPEETHNFPLFI